jgi:hypothetical protein
MNRAASSSVASSTPGPPVGSITRVSGCEKSCRGFLLRRDMPIRLSVQSAFFRRMDYDGNSVPNDNNPILNLFRHSIMRCACLCRTTARASSVRLRIHLLLAALVCAFCPRLPYARALASPPLRDVWSPQWCNSCPWPPRANVRVRTNLHQAVLVRVFCPRPPCAPALLSRLLRDVSFGRPPASNWMACGHIIPRKNKRDQNQAFEDDSVSDP